MAIEVHFQQLRNDLITLNRSRLTLDDSLAKGLTDTASEALKETLTYGGIAAKHLKEASAMIRAGGLKPTSVTLQIGGMVVSWDLTKDS